MKAGRNKRKVNVEELFLYDADKGREMNIGAGGPAFF